MIVVDTSVVLNALCDVGVKGEQARAALLADDNFAAPAHFPIEFLSSLRGLVLGKKIVVEDAAAALKAFKELGIEIFPATEMDLERAWSLRENITAYDAAYISLAERLGAALITQDARLSRTGQQSKCAVRVLS